MYVIHSAMFEGIKNLFQDLTAKDLKLYAVATIKGLGTHSK